MWSVREMSPAHCPCCKECKFCPGFQRVLDSRNAGFVLYRHTTRVEDIDKRTGAIKTATDTEDDVFVIENTQDVPLYKLDLTPEIGRNKIRCPRCVNIIKHAQSLLQNQGIGAKDLIGVCGHCRGGQVEGKCFKCNDIIEKLQQSKRTGKVSRTQKVKDWLTKIQGLIQTLADDKGKKQSGQINRSISDVDIKRLLRTASQTNRGPWIEDLFLHDIRESNFYSQKPTSERSYYDEEFKNKQVKFYDTNSRDERGFYELLPEKQSDVTLTESELEKINMLKKSYNNKLRDWRETDIFLRSGVGIEDEIYQGDKRDHAIPHEDDETPNKHRNTTGRKENITKKGEKRKYSLPDLTGSNMPSNESFEDIEQMLMNHFISLVAKGYTQGDSNVTHPKMDLIDKIKKKPKLVSETIMETPTRLRKYHSEESVLAGMTTLPGAVQRSFFYYFPNANATPRKKGIAKREVSSSKLIKDTIDKLAEQEREKHEESVANKKRLDEEKKERELAKKYAKDLEKQLKEREKEEKENKRQEVGKGGQDLEKVQGQAKEQKQDNKEQPKLVEKEETELEKEKIDRKKEKIDRERDTKEKSEKEKKDQNKLEKEKQKTKREKVDREKDKKEKTDQERVKKEEGKEDKEREKTEKEFEKNKQEKEFKHQERDRKKEKKEQDKDTNKIALAKEKNEQKKGNELVGKEFIPKDRIKDGKGKKAQPTETQFKEGKTKVVKSNEKVVPKRKTTQKEDMEESLRALQGSEREKMINKLEQRKKDENGNKMEAEKAKEATRPLKHQEKEKKVQDKEKNKTAPDIEKNEKKIGKEDKSKEIISKDRVKNGKGKIAEPTENQLKEEKTKVVKTAEITINGKKNDTVLPKGKTTHNEDMEASFRVIQARERDKMINELRQQKDEEKRKKIEANKSEKPARALKHQEREEQEKVKKQDSEIKDQDNEKENEEKKGKKVEGKEIISKDRVKDGKGKRAEPTNTQLEEDKTKVVKTAEIKLTENKIDEKMPPKGKTTENEDIIVSFAIIQAREREKMLNALRQQKEEEKRNKIEAEKAEEAAGAAIKKGEIAAKEAEKALKEAKDKAQQSKQPPSEETLKPTENQPKKPKSGNEKKIKCIKIKRPSIYDLVVDKDRPKERLKAKKKSNRDIHNLKVHRVKEGLEYMLKEKEEELEHIKMEVTVKKVIVGETIHLKSHVDDAEVKESLKEGHRPLIFGKYFEENIEHEINTPFPEPQLDPDSLLNTEGRKDMIDPDYGKGVVLYALSNRSFIEKGWTMLPTEKVVRKINVYRMRPAHPEFDWFKRNKNKGLLEYDTGEKLADFDDNGRGCLYYKSGNLALDYYNAEEVNAQQRFVVYSSGEPDERGKTHPRTVLATFDYLGNGIVFDHAGKIRLKYNQTEGVVIDRTLGPVSHWKWHTLNDPPVLQQVMIDTQLAHKDPQIMKLGNPTENKPRPEDEEMLAIEFDNFIKEKSAKLTQSFKPFQIKMKALKINEYFSLRVLDQATIYLIYRDGPKNIKLNIGMLLDHKEIVDTDTAEVGEVSSNLERLPARTDSLAELQHNVAHAQKVDRSSIERDRRIRRPLPSASADRFTAAVSRPLKPPLRGVDSASTVAACKCRKTATCNVYYNTGLM